MDHTNFNRTRRLRISDPIRKMLRENHVRPEQLIKPMFVHERSDITTIDSLPNTHVLPIDKLLMEVEKLIEIGILGINIYPSIPEEKRDNTGLEALNPKGIVPAAITAIKRHFPDFVVIPDVALDPYTLHCHDGILDEGGNILNDTSVAILAEQSTLFASCGADIVAPSDMFDGRTKKIREALDEAGYNYVGIIAYAAKYASSMYNPFRNAIRSNFVNKIDKRSYQIEPANSMQAIDEILCDLDEGADIIMIKPATFYLDIVSMARKITNKPIAVFHVSGECAMIKAACASGVVNESDVLLEAFVSMKRAGADIIFSYFADTFANNIAKNY